MNAMRRGKAISVFALLAFAALQSCDCEDDLVEVPTPSCDLDTHCKSNQSYRNGQCLSTYCEDDSECCPGNLCNTITHGCQPVSVQADFACRSDAECLETFQDPGLRCWKESADGVLSDEGQCRYRECTEDADCSGLTCFQGWCVAQAPCGAGCPEGSVCEVGSNTCHPAAGNSGCDKVCDPGSVLVLSDPEVMVGEICCPLSCQCATLPPLQPGVVGRFASLAIGSNELLVSAYDESFGDLVVAHYTGQGDLKWYSYVDGVPATGALGGDPNGPRRGLVEPGPDVGQYSSLVVNSRGEPCVAYYDVDNGDLRVAMFDLAAGGWSTQIVDADHDAGRFASMVIDPDGDLLRISYMVSGLSLAGHDRAELRVATARVPKPLTSNDWQIATVDSSSLLDPCGDSCSASQSCVRDQGQALCRDNATNCSSSCASGQRCVDVDGHSQCLGALPVDMAGLPNGVGLFSQLSHAGDKDLVVYYDSLQGALKAAYITASGPQSPVLIDGDGLDGHSSGDVGQFPSAAYFAAEDLLAIAYQDLTQHRLMLYQGSDLSSGSYSVIADGAAHPPGRSFVGADSRVAFSESGDLFVVYQDSSMMDLKLAKRATTAQDWSIRGLLAEGAYGFDVDLALTPNVAYVVSAAPRLDARRRLASRLMLFIYPQ